MRSVLASLLALGLTVALLTSADAAPVHRSRASKPHFRTAHDAIVDPSPSAASPGARFAVPGWTDEETRRWLDNANSCSSCGG